MRVEGAAIATGVAAGLTAVERTPEGIGEAEEPLFSVACFLREEVQGIIAWNTDDVGGFRPTIVNLIRQVSKLNAIQIVSYRLKNRKVARIHARTGGTILTVGE
jgi:hypothetical protein